jgi:hypothetical protein
VLRYFRDRLERYLAVGRFAEMGLFEDRRARERALALLVRSLSPAQRAEFQRSNTFTVRGSRSGQRYRITYATTANVEALGPQGTIERRLCAGPMGVPIPSVMLAQKLMLESEEPEFLRIAARGTGTTPAPDFPQFSG